MRARVTRPRRAPVPARAGAAPGPARAAPARTTAARTAAPWTRRGYRRGGRCCRLRTRPCGPSRRNSTVVALFLLTWYDVLLELSAAPRRAAAACRTWPDRVVLSRTRVSLVVGRAGRPAGLVGKTRPGTDRRVVQAQHHRRRPGRRCVATAPHYLRGIQRYFARHLSAADKATVARALTRVSEALPCLSAHLRLSGTSGASYTPPGPAAVTPRPDRAAAVRRRAISRCHRARRPAGPGTRRMEHISMCKRSVFALLTAGTALSLSWPPPRPRSLSRHPPGPRQPRRPGPRRRRRWRRWRWWRRPGGPPVTNQGPGSLGTHWTPEVDARRQRHDRRADRRRGVRDPRTGPAELGYHPLRRPRSPSRSPRRSARTASRSTAWPPTSPAPST